MKTLAQTKCAFEIRIWARLLHTRTSQLRSSIIFFHFFSSIKLNCSHHIGLSVRRHILHQWGIIQWAGESGLVSAVRVHYQINTNYEAMDFLVRWQNDCAKVFSMHILTALAHNFFVNFSYYCCIFPCVIGAESDQEKIQITKRIKIIDIIFDDNRIRKRETNTKKKLTLKFASCGLLSGDEMCSSEKTTSTDFGFLDMCAKQLRIWMNWVINSELHSTHSVSSPCPTFASCKWQSHINMTMEINNNKRSYLVRSCTWDRH